MHSSFNRLLTNLALAWKKLTHLLRRPTLGIPLGLYDALIDNVELRQTTRKIFADTHYALAVEEAFKCANNLVKRRSGNNLDDGSKLMQKVFSVDSPILSDLNPSEISVAKGSTTGYQMIMAGAMIGIRNPRAHEHAFPDEPKAALEMLALANHLMRLIDTASRARRKRSTH